MASTAVNVPNPVSTPTSTQLAQIAANITTVIANGNRNGSYQDLYDQITDVATAVNCLAQALLTIANATASSVGTVNVRGAYALGATATIPTNIGTAAV